MVVKNTAKTEKIISELISVNKLTTPSLSTSIDSLGGFSPEGSVIGVCHDPGLGTSSLAAIFHLSIQGWVSARILGN